MASGLRATGENMTTECEDAGHDPKDDEKTVRGYEVEHGEFYPRWLCNPCAEELESCGARMRSEAETSLQSARYRNGRGERRW